jgi:hypothetical protein
MKPAVLLVARTGVPSIRAEQEQCGKARCRATTNRHGLTEHSEKAQRRCKSTTTSYSRVRSALLGRSNTSPRRRDGTCRLLHPLHAGGARGRARPLGQGDAGHGHTVTLGGEHHWQAAQNGPVANCICVTALALCVGAAVTHGAPAYIPPSHTHTH